MTKLYDLGPNDSVCSVPWTREGSYISVGTSLGKVQDWDEFQTMYLEYLANRLLFSDSANIDAERSMISKLKEKGWWKTDQMERMCKDFESKKEINEYFKKSLKVLRQLPTGTEPSVLPLEPSVQGIELPKRMSESFKNGISRGLYLHGI